ncbi:uncharacterized protein ACA1_324890 [Acanthamoeba castellanii str. Neff]|uniref:Uncharacterized protein n=1 Tax=Acanthamoeba castellanii (strain ATCC 30010 / Neff) TaxID=1257118 RepID=L8GHH1_ACACF|nr:uncharacterized protein ACA1_324890 [Acanthamoeba castellanii str. Neff]ELR12442.1 hypothetical protein ACA1_324890 [Acanthamoeba castellanii str. Neff]
MQSQLALQQPQPQAIQDVAVRAQRGIAGWLNSLGVRTAQPAESATAMMAAPVDQLAAWRMRPGAVQNMMANMAQPVGTMFMAPPQPLPQPAQGSNVTAQGGRGRAAVRLDNNNNSSSRNNGTNDATGNGNRRGSNNSARAAMAPMTNQTQTAPPTSLSAPMPVSQQAPHNTHASALRDWHASKTNEGLWIGTYGHRDLAASMDAGCGAAAAWRAMDPRLGARQNGLGANNMADGAAWPSPSGPQYMWPQQPQPQPQQSQPMNLAMPMMMPMPLPQQQQQQQQQQQTEQQVMIMPTLDEGTFLMCRPFAFDPSGQPPQILPAGPEMPPPLAPSPSPPVGTVPAMPDDGNTRVVIQPYPYLPSLFYGQPSAPASSSMQGMWASPDGPWIIQ